MVTVTIFNSIGMESPPASVAPGARAHARVFGAGADFRSPTKGEPASEIPAHLYPHEPPEVALADFLA